VSCIEARVVLREGTDDIVSNTYCLSMGGGAWGPVAQDQWGGPPVGKVSECWQRRPGWPWGGWGFGLS